MVGLHMRIKIFLLVKTLFLSHKNRLIYINIYIYIMQTFDFVKSKMVPYTNAL